MKDKEKIKKEEKMKVATYCRVGRKEQLSNSDEKSKVN